MSKARTYAAVLLLALAPTLTSCRIFRKPKREPAPPPPPFQTVPKPAQTPPPAPPLEPPPQLPPSGQVQDPISLPNNTKLPPPAPAKKRPSPAGPRVPAATEPPPPSVSPAPAPQLRPMLTQVQRQELERSLRERIGRAQGILASVAGRRLSAGQREQEGQIRNFIRQAEEARDTDLLRANNLAERAEVLAQDLARRLR